MESSLLSTRGQPLLQLQAWFLATTGPHLGNSETNSLALKCLEGVERENSLW